MKRRFKLPTLNDLLIIGGLALVAVYIWVKDPKHRVDPYKDEVDE